MMDSDAYDYGDPKSPGYAETMFERADLSRRIKREEESADA